ncbi:Phospholipase ytpA [uncultured Blautia sp.]|nr:alpha/beta hydrolase [Hoministercoradaptatus ammoniilyticus]SCJ12017.1 Phospholipase ytpA [uncultured Blautia sp.]
MERLILSEQGYREQMKNVVEPYLDIRKSVLWPEREEGKKIYCERYLADSPKGVVMISHGFTETAEKYKEVVYYFVKKQYHVYLPEYCGHGRSYRLISDSSLIHVDDYQRYVNDFLYVAKMAAKENPGLPVFLYGHSMGGGLAAAEAAQEPELFKKVVLSSPMIRPATGNILWPVAKQIAFGACQQGKGAEYVVGQHPYEGRENFENSSSTCRVRFEYYQDKKEKEPLFQTNGASYSWLYQAGRLNRYLQRKAWKQIQAPVLIFQSAEDHLVSKPEQVRFVVKLARRGLTSGTMIIVPGTKHEIYGSGSRILRGYWKRIFAFLEEPQVGKNGSGK